MEMPKPKPKHRKGLWSPEEDQRLRDYVLNNGHGCWSSVPINAGLQRNGKSCRLRWINYLRPGLKRGMFTLHEEETILNLHRMLGNKWSQIAHHLSGRTDNEIKNYWHSCLKKKLAQIEAPTAHHIKSERNSHTESTLSQDLPTTQNPTPAPSLPNILFVDWLALDDDNSNNTAYSFSDFDHQPSFCENGFNAMSSHSDMLQYEELVQSVPFSGDGGFENRNENFENIISRSSYYCGNMYGTMDDLGCWRQSYHNLSNVNGVHSSNDLTYI